MQYSDDLRQKLVQAWQAGHGTQIELAEWFGVSLSWVEKVLRRWRTTGQTAARPFRHGPLPVLHPDRLEQLVLAAPGCHAEGTGLPFESERLDGVPYPATPRSAAQKKTLHASERDTPRVERLRARWRKTRRGLDPRRLIFVDESGVNLALTRRYARAPRGVRAVGAVPQNYGQNLSVLAALDRRGMRAALLMPGATDREVFLLFLEHVLAPQLRPGAVVVMDNLSVHKSAAVAEAVQRAGAQLCYLPPYSPDYNPIERAWSKIKTFLRGVGARTRRKLSRALQVALAQITPQDAEAWFRHGGYPLH